MKTIEPSRRVMRITERLVEKHWSKIEKSAEKLLEVTTLDGDDLVQFLDGLTGSSPESA